MPPPSSIWGHVEVQAEDFYRTKALEWAREYGPVIRLKLNMMDIVVLNDLESIKKFICAKEVLNRSQCFVVRRDYYAGLGNLNGDIWSANKKFSMTMLRDLGFAKTAMEESMMEEFNYLAGRIGETKGQPVNVFEYMLPCVSNNIASFFYARNMAHDHPSRFELHRLIYEMCIPFKSGPSQLFVPRPVRWLLDHVPFTRMGRIDSCMTALENFTRNQLDEFKSATNDVTDEDFVHGYTKKIEECASHRNPAFTDRYLVGNVNAFIMGGSTSTATTMCWHLLVYAKNVDGVQNRVQMEIDEVVGADRRPTWDDRKAMPFTLACVWEVDRWKTAAPLGAARECAEDVVIDEFFIPRGTTVLPNFWAVHNDPTAWKNPHEFQPSRFLNEDGSIKSCKPEHWIPFGLGRRSCPGEMFASMEIFLMVTFLLQKFRIVPETPIECDLNSPALVLPQQVPVKLRFLPRHQEHHP